MAAGFVSAAIFSTHFSRFLFPLKGTSCFVSLISCLLIKLPVWASCASLPTVRFIDVNTDTAITELTSEDASFAKNSVQVLKGFGDRKGVKITPALFAVFQNAAQVMARDLYRERIGYDVPGFLLVLKPGGMGQSDPDRTVVDEKLDVYGIRVAGGDGHDDALIDTADRSSSPTLDSFEILIHRQKLYSDRGAPRNVCRAESAV
jgi:hypothetical protein